MEHQEFYVGLFSTWHKADKEYGMQESIVIECDMQESIVIECDTIEHTEVFPFCSDMDCPCHSDRELIDTHIYQPMQAGTMTVIEANRLWRGKQV